MNPDVLLTAVAALAGFGLKTAVGFGLCLVLSRLVGSARARFVVWLLFLCGSAGYWLFVARSAFAGSTAFSVNLSGVASSVADTQAFSRVPAVAAWQVPEAWSLGITWAVRAAVVLYLLAVACLLFDHLRKRLHLRWVLSFTTEPPAEVTAAFQRLAHGLHAGRSRLLMLSGATSPATFGWVRPTILLPTICLEEQSSALEDILRHELHHVRRGDSLWNGVAVACRALLCFHPAAWFAVRKLQFDRELACDQAVVAQSPSRRANYAECLLRFARLNMVPDPRNWGVDFAASAEHLTVRVHSILAEPRKVSALASCLRAASGLALIFSFAALTPSLAILLSFAHAPLSIAGTDTVQDSSAAVATRAKLARKFRSAGEPRSKAEASPRSATADAQSSANVASQVAAEKQITAQATAGPQLLHRSSSSGAAANKPQSIELIDTDAEGRVIKPQDHEARQTIQQTATAALGIYKRATEIDRH
jgi:beta-lactamase regulating signal transducer with metallopeptidase domain